MAVKDRFNSVLIWANELPAKKVIAWTASLWLFFLGLSFLIADPDFTRRTFLFGGLQSLGGTRFWSVLAMISGVYIFYGNWKGNLRSIFFGSSLGLMLMAFAVAIYAEQLWASWNSITNVAAPLATLLAFLTFKSTVALGRKTEWE